MSCLELRDAGSTHPSYCRFNVNESIDLVLRCPGNPDWNFQCTNPLSLIRIRVRESAPASGQYPRDFIGGFDDARALGSRSRCGQY